MFFNLTALAFGVVALGLWFVAFKRLMDGRIGAAIFVGLLALIMTGAAGAVGVYVD